MSQLFEVARFGTSLVAGIVGGVVAVQVLSPSDTQAPAAPPRDRGRIVYVQQAVPDGGGPVHMHESQAMLVQSSSATPGPPNLVLVGPSPSADMLVAAYNADFEAEPLDGAWARSARYDLMSAVEEQSDSVSGGQLVGVECRSHQCRMGLRWPDYQSALRQATQLVSGRWPLNCANRMSLPPPENAGDVYEGYLFFDCRGVEGNGSR